ncbi:MAG: GDSL-type esterase/lipase family protein [Microgenomates group bacterium]
MSQENICIFGDSITWGPRLPFRVAWANLLRNHLEKSASDLFRVYDLGVDMDTTKDVLARMDTEAKSRKPAIIIFNIGTNDSLYRMSLENAETTLEEFEKNIRELINKARAYTERVLVVGLVKGSDKWTTPLIQSTTGKTFTKERTRVYDRKLKEIAAEMKVAFADVNNKLDDADFDDGLHPNANGHMKMFAVISKELDPLLGLKHDMYVTLVDEMDKVIGKKLVDAVESTDITRVTGLWVENTNGEVLLAKRPKDKRRDPNRWGPAVATHIYEQESYLAAIKEAAEKEIGLSGVIFEESNKLRVHGENNFYCQLYYLKSDLVIDQLNLNSAEVQTVEWKSKKQLSAEYAENPQFFVQSFGDYLAVFNE